MLANDIMAGMDQQCLVILTDPLRPVTIDLAGFTIRGTDRTGFGIVDRDSARGHAVRNGSITNFQRGLSLQQTEGAIVEGLRVFGNSMEGMVVRSGIVRGNTVLDSGSGIDVREQATVINNYARNNGVGITVGAGSTVIGNTAVNNSNIGFIANCPSNLTDNTAVNNGTNLVLNGADCHDEDNVAP
jgi:hypothetical protein